LLQNVEPAYPFVPQSEALLQAIFWFEQLPAEQAWLDEQEV